MDGGFLQALYWYNFLAKGSDGRLLRRELHQPGAVPQGLLSMTLAATFTSFSLLDLGLSPNQHEAFCIQLDILF